jgi:hypothetical protein
MVSSGGRLGVNFAMLPDGHFVVLNIAPTFWSYFRNRSGGRWMSGWGALCAMVVVRLRGLATSHRERLISNEVSRKLVRELDLLESRHQQ